MSSKIQIDLKTIQKNRIFKCKVVYAHSFQICIKHLHQTVTILTLTKTYKVRNSVGTLFQI